MCLEPCLDRMCCVLQCQDELMTTRMPREFEPCLATGSSCGRQRCRATSGTAFKYAVDHWQSFNSCLLQAKAMQIQREQQRLLLHTQRPSLCTATAPPGASALRGSASCCVSTSQNWEASPAHLIHIQGVAKLSPCRRRCVDAGLCTSSDASPRHQAEIRRCHALPNETHISTFTTPGCSDAEAVETDLWMISARPSCQAASEAFAVAAVGRPLGAVAGG